jgi:hypothetical protein
VRNYAIEKEVRAKYIIYVVYSPICRYYQSASSVTAAKFDKCLHFIPIVIAPKLIIYLKTRYVSLNTIRTNIILKPNIFIGTRT